MQLFNWHNDATFHYYAWLAGRPENVRLVDQLLQAAWDDLPQDEWFQLGLGTTEVLQEKLALQLESDMEDRLSERIGCLPEEAAIGAVGSVETDPLFAPLLARVVAEIDYSTVAEAILRDRGKWAPDIKAPDVQ